MILLRLVSWPYFRKHVVRTALTTAGIVLGVGLFLAYTRPPLILYGTLWILLVAYVTIELPSAYQQMQSAYMFYAQAAGAD